MRPRILTTQGKLVYVVFGSIAMSLLAVTGLALSGGTGAGALGAAVAVLAFWAWIVVGARLFRGDGEPVEPPRAWWRLTAAPKAGFVIAGVLLLQLLVGAVTVWAMSLGATSGDLVDPGTGRGPSGPAALA
ncbi:MAG: hypothetical protein Q7T71_16370, partial [Herbiconiux sp.]|nr:hypothetical protein [Herbiconiux sp.]